MNEHYCGSACVFTKVDLKTSICRASGKRHVCSDSCGTIHTEGKVLCGLTKRIMSEISVNCYYDGTQSFYPKRKKKSNASLNPESKRKIIVDMLMLLFDSTELQVIEKKVTKRIHKCNLQKITKEARLLRSSRHNWHSYFFLFLKHSARRRKMVPCHSAIYLLASNILLFWETLFGGDSFQAKKLIIFAATCVSELAAENESKVFPNVPWLIKCLADHSVIQIYSGCLDITCRSMTSMLMLIHDKFKKNNDLVFPV
jgi:hypothetical protein